MSAVTPQQFLAWKTACRSGDVFEYHRGFLAMDRTNWQHAAFGGAVAWLAVQAWLSGQYDLYQVRHGWCDYSYFVRCRGKRDSVQRFWHRSTPESIVGVQPHRMHRIAA